MKATLEGIFLRLADHFGPLHWWPAQTPFEVAVGAILTQNTAWTNVEKALVNLRSAERLHPEALRACPREELEVLIRPAGFFRQKSQRLHLLTAHLHGRHGGRLETLLEAPLEDAREELLSLKGIGPETADSILLYAGGIPSFVVDAYTRRLLTRLGILRGEEGYEEIRSLFMEHLPPDPAMYGEFHALIVEECKTFCRKRPLCPGCPLYSQCPSRLESLT